MAYDSAVLRYFETNRRFDQFRLASQSYCCRESEKFARDILLQECSHGSGKCWRMRGRMRSGGSVERGIGLTREKGF